MKWWNQDQDLTPLNTFQLSQSLYFYPYMGSLINKLFLIKYNFKIKFYLEDDAPSKPGYIDIVWLSICHILVVTDIY